MKTLDVLEHILKARRRRPDTDRLFNRTFNAFAQAVPESPTSRAVVVEWLTSDKTHASETLRLYYRILKTAALYMAEEYELPNPVPKKCPIPHERKPRRTFTQDEMSSLMLTAAKDETDRLLLALLIDSTARIGELANGNLILANIVDDGFITHGKTGVNKHRCRPELIAEMRTILQHQKCVFESRDGIPTCAHALGDRFARLAKRAGIKGSKLGPHTIHHTMASMIAKSTKSALIVKSLLGHADIQTSMKYIHEADDDLQQQTSPLALLEDRTQQNFTQPALTPAIIEPISQGTQIIDLLELEYKEVPTGKNFHPTISSEKLLLMRRTFIAYTKTQTSKEDNKMMVDFFNGILRKTKG